MVGEVRASSSERASTNGVMRKKMVAVATLKAVVIKKLFSERFISSKSFRPTESPTPMIGPINGEISMAPIMTAVELTFNPREAMKMAKIRIHRLAPLNSTPFRMESTVANSFSLSFLKSKYSFRNDLIANIFLFLLSASIIIFFLQID